MEKKKSPRRLNPMTVSDTGAYFHVNDTELVSPSDRIGRNYSLEARALNHTIIGGSTFPKSKNRSPSAGVDVLSTALPKRRFDVDTWKPEPLLDSKYPSLPSGGKNSSNNVDEYHRRFQERLVKFQMRDVCGRKCELVTHKEAWEDHVFNGLPLTPSIDDDMRQTLLANLLGEIRVSYAECMKVSILEYQLRSPRTQSELDVDPTCLRDSQFDWTNKEYQNYNWRVLRETGVSTKRVVDSSVLIEKLLVVQPVLADILATWEKMDMEDGFVDFESIDFLLQLPMKASEFNSHVEKVADEARTTLKESWLSDTSEILSVAIKHDTLTDPDTKELVLNDNARRLIVAASCIMSSQVRSSMEDSIDLFSKFFETFHKNETITSPLFLIELALDNDDKLVFIPTPEELIVQVHNGLDAIVAAGGSLPNVDGERHLGPCELHIEDQSINDIKNSVADIIQERYKDSSKLVSRFLNFSQLYDGSEDTAIAFQLKNRKFGAESRSSLKDLNAELERFREIQNVVENTWDDRECFSMFVVDCSPIKQAIKKKAESFVSTVQTQIAQDNSDLMKGLCDKYAEIVSTLLAEPEDSEALQRLMSYCKEISGMIKDMEKCIVMEVSPRVNFAVNYDYHMSESDVSLLNKVFSYPGKVWEAQHRSEKLQEDQKQMRIQVLERRKEIFSDELRRMEEDCKKLQTFGDIAGTEKYLARVNSLRESMTQAESEIDGIQEQEDLLSQESSVAIWLSRHGNLKKMLEPFALLWDTVSQHYEQSTQWMKISMTSLDAEEVDRESDNTRRAMTKLVKEFERQELPEPLKVANQILCEAKIFLEEYCPLLLLLCNPGLKERHWNSMADITELPLEYSPDLCLDQVVKLGLHKFTDKIEDTCVAANKEYSLEKGMNKMEEEWDGMEFICKLYRNTGAYIIGGIDEVQTLLDDHIVKAQAMRSSRYIQPMIKRITEWEGTLNALQDIIDNWLQLQGTWLYLEPIFGSPDIMKQMPAEAKMFNVVDDIWRDAVGQTAEIPSVIVTARRAGLVSDLVRANQLMDEIQKGLNNYLETKRLCFPRFFFLSNDELLEILSETKDPLRVQPHLKKAFEGINNLEFTQDLDIVAMFSPEKERVDFVYDEIDHEVINPNKAGGNVEVWLVQTEIVMRRSVALFMDRCMRAYAECSERTEWVMNWQGQMLIGVSQTFWTQQVEKSLREKGNAGLFEYYEVLKNQLKDIVTLVRGDLPKLARTAIGAMVTLDVHSRDTVQQLADAGVSSPFDFDWISQLRYYWYDNGVSAKTGVPGSLDVKMITAVREYDYEYLGCSGRLVVTPLTDRCYRTLMGALQLLYGGAPEGPAGTGKTETTKDLGKAVAVQTVVFNCSDGLDYLAMGKFFKGLLASGAWACFDEFNRIELEVLSVVAQQILTIQRGKVLKLDMLDFEGTRLPLKHGCNVYITMNPGYAGRSDLPDNLKALFRPCAMMVPDYAMIGEIILYSFGYLNAKVLAKKIVSTYKLCSEQLSSQKHYDYGMRAVMSVLRAAGAQKRLPENRETDESILMLRSIIDVNEPKFLSQDMPLFGGIVGDLFPGVSLPKPDRSVFRWAFEETCSKLNLQTNEYFYDKVIQVYEMMLVRHGFMVVGLPFGGKTASWTCLQHLLTLLHHEYPDDPRWTTVVPVVINPKSISMGMLYGQFDPTTHEWTDGVLAIKYRDCANNKIGLPDDRKWVMFDGPVDAIWIENMNTVLDDNKKLCLQSGEMIALSDVMSMMFEPMDLEVASPATVSRCGVIFFEPHRLRWFPILDSWFDRITVDEDIVLDQEEQQYGFSVTIRQRRLLHVLFYWLMEPCMLFVRKECKEEAPTVDSNLVVSCINLLESNLSELLQGTDRRQATDAELETYFIFSLIWSLGASIDSDSRKKFSDFLRQVLGDDQGTFIQNNYSEIWIGLQARDWSLPNFCLDVKKEEHEAAETEERSEDTQVEVLEKPKKHYSELEWAQSDSKRIVFSNPLPDTGLVYDYVYLPEEARWKDWVETLDETRIPYDAEYSAIVVPTAVTAQFSHLMRLLFTHQKPTLCVGPTGTGKSTYVVNVLMDQLDQSVYTSIITAFSANTSAAQLQDIIDGRLDRRRKGVFGPALGKKYVLFVDDLNMPTVEEYGAQPPIELLRQFSDNGGWFDLKEKSFRRIIDTLLVAAMGPPGGGRNFITPRMMRHFNVLTFTEFTDETLVRIFKTISSWHFSKPGFNESCKDLCTGIVKATLESYSKAKLELLPTPSKSHYTFNLRDFSRVVQGVCMISPQVPGGVDKALLVRLWVHEMQRVFGDRLTVDEDRQWFIKFMKTLAPKHFNMDFNQIFKHLKKEDDTSEEVTVDDLRALFFGDYMVQGADPRLYNEIQDSVQVGEVLDAYLVEYNSISKQPMPLVLFLFAIEHVSRISRVLSMPGGNALLVGVGGSGRQSLTRLAAFMADFDLIQIEISKNYNKAEWQEDLKKVIRAAALNVRDAVFLFSDSQIKLSTFVEDINNLLNAGEIPNLFPNDEKSECLEGVRPFAKQVYGKRAADMGPMELWQFFVKRVKQKLHVVLAFSPIGSDFRDRLRMYPSLINCCVIDWFSAWPADALVAVAQRFLADLVIEPSETKSRETIIEEIVLQCQAFHTSIQDLSVYFRESMRRVNYVTPTSYLELILAYKGSLATSRDMVLQGKKRYEVGLEKLDFAANAVADMQKQLTDLQPVLAQSQIETDALMVQIQEKLPGVNATKEAVGKDAAVAQAEADRVGAIKKECEDDLSVAMPLLQEAVDALDTLKPADINEVKNFKTPPGGVVLTMEAVCIMLNVKVVKAKDPNDPTKKIDDWWTPSKKLLADPQFMKMLKDYDKDNIEPAYMAKIRAKFVPDPNFTPDLVKKSSNAACGMCKWVLAMEAYDRVAKVVAPKKAALAEAESTLGVTMGELQLKQEALKAVEDELGALEQQFEDATQKKVDLEAEVDLCGKKLDRAKTLIDGLGGEKTRWTESAFRLTNQCRLLTGDVLVSAGLIAYLGPFTSALRDKTIASWVSQCIERGIPTSPDASLSTTLGDAVAARQWHADGLPTDSFSVDNGIIVFNSRRWPLLIDPQGQANKWIRNMEKDNGLHVIKLSDGNYLRTVENAVQFGQPVLLENVGEVLDAALEPLLLKQTFKQGGVECIRLGDSTVEYSPDFKFYITTKLPNPHYLPEVAVKVTLLNFMITPNGLEDQLLGIVVQEERPDLAEEKARLIVEGAENSRKLKDLEDNILHILSSSSGNILEDESAINALNSSKILSNEIAAKQEIAEKTEKDIDAVRQGYRPVAYHGQLLYFCIADMANIEPVYQYSLGWYSALFINGIRNSEKSDNLENRLELLKDYFTYSLYCNICRSLLEKDKLLFAFLLTVKILMGRKQMDEEEWYFFLTGGVAMENTLKNPTDWLADKQWGEICRLSDLYVFQGLRETFVEDVDCWKAMYDKGNAHRATMPARWSSISSFQKMLLLRCIRPDKVTLAVQDFVISVMGEPFVTPPPFDLPSCYADSNALSPLIFILSPGSDPMSALLKFGDSVKQQVASISLGQGQGPIAEKMISSAQENGTWVVLQNCHLAVSWMTAFERICEHITVENTSPNFRMWCTTYPSASFPVSVLQNGVKMTNEPPKGFRANLVGSYMGDPVSDPAFFEGAVSSEKESSFHLLLFGLCIFHSLVQERRQFGPLGWNIPYEFNDSDLRISIKQLAFFIDQFDQVPFKALQYCTGECNYGGRVTDDKDRRALHVILERCYSPNMLQTGFSMSPSGAYKVPDYSVCSSHGDFIEHIEQFPLVADPEIFGMHENATITKDNTETSALFASILLTQSSNSSGAGMSPDEVMDAVAEDILSKLPDQFNLELAQVRYPVRWDESMNTVLQQELVRYNRLTAVIRPSLINLRKAVKGTVVMSKELEEVGNACFYGVIPDLWMGKSYPSLKPLGGYISDLFRRLDMLGSWLTTTPPPVFWISGFYFTQAFLTGALQNYARKEKIPIDSVTFDFEMMAESTYSKGPDSTNGAYVDGLFLDGARWDKDINQLADPLPKVLFSAGPVMWFRPIPEDKLVLGNYYDSPVYKTGERKGVLATTGHSSNFVMYIRIPSDKPKGFWIERGVALLTQLND